MSALSLAEEFELVEACRDYKRQLTLREDVRYQLADLRRATAQGEARAAQDTYAKAEQGRDLGTSPEEAEQLATAVEEARQLAEQREQAAERARHEAESILPALENEAKQQLVARLVEHRGLDRELAEELVEAVWRNPRYPAEAHVAERRDMDPSAVLYELARQDPQRLVRALETAAESYRGDEFSDADARRHALQATAKDHGMTAAGVEEAIRRERARTGNREADQFEGRPSPAAARHTPLTLGDAAPEPRWLVPGLLKPGRIHVMAGDTHVGKTILTWAMIAADLRGTPFLGRPVSVGKWVVIDAENPREDLEAYWLALGVSQYAIDERVRWIDAQELGVALGEADWDAWVESQVRDFGASAVVLDTLPATTAVELTDNTGVVDLYRRSLKPLARKLDVAVWAPTHEHKNEQRGGQRSMRVLGARQWVAQADALFTVAQVEAQTTEQRDDGVRTRSVLALWREKMRPEGRWASPEHVEFRGELEQVDGALRSLEVRSAEDVTDTERLIGVLQSHGPMPKGRLAEQVGWSRTGTRFEKALTEGLEAGHLSERTEGRQTIITTNTEEQ